MRDARHYRQMLDRNPNATIGFTLAAAMVYATRYGECEADDRSSNKFKTIARQLKSKYGESLEHDQVSTEMDAAKRLKTFGHD